MNEKYLEEVSKLDWNKIGKSLKAVSVFWVENTFGKANARLPKGYTLDDIVQDALMRSFNRSWEEEFNEGRFIKYLFGAVRSIVSNLAKSGDNTKTDRTITHREHDDEGATLTLEAIAIVKEDFAIKIDYEKVLGLLEKEIQGNLELEQVLTAIRLGLQPKEIAEELEKDVKEIYKLKRQLYNIVEKISKTL